MSAWIDFRKLRQDVDFPSLLQHYKVQLRINGSQGQGFCPLPTHRGQRRSPSFSVNFDKKCWQCFGCQAHGNVIDFAVRMEGKLPSDTTAVREVAEMLQEKFVPAAFRNEGGGLSNHGETTLTGCTLTGNNANFDGGGIYNAGTLTIVDSLITGNTVAEGDFALGGGGIYNEGQLTVINSTVSGNNADQYPDIFDANS
jgi:hypothetical protein